MKTTTLVRLRVVIYTLVSLCIAWSTTMTDVSWSGMHWEQQSCLICGILVLWGNTMMAFFDKSVWKADEERKAANGETTK